MEQRLAIVVRTENAMARTIKNIENQYIIAIPCPLGRIKALPAPSAAAAPGILLVTSRNAVESMAEAEHLRQRPMLTVGEETAALARSLGFRAQAGGKNVKEIQSYIAKHYTLGKDRFLYLRGRDVREDLAAALAEKGFETQEHIVYAMELSPTLPQAVQAALAAPQGACVMLFSARLAERFIALGGGLRRHTAIAISPEVAKLAQGHFGNVHAAKEPTLSGMIAAMHPSAAADTHRPAG